MQCTHRGIVVQKRQWIWFSTMAIHPVISITPVAIIHVVVGCFFQDWLRNSPGIKYITNYISLLRNWLTLAQNVKRYATFRHVTYKPWSRIAFKPLFVGCVGLDTGDEPVVDGGGYLVFLVQVHCGLSLFYIDVLLDFSALPLLLFGQIFTILDGDWMSCGQAVITLSRWIIQVSVFLNLWFCGRLISPM